MFGRRGDSQPPVLEFDFIPSDPEVRLLGAVPLPDSMQGAMDALKYRQGRQEVAERFAYAAAARVFEDKTPFIDATAGVRKMLGRRQLGFEDIPIPLPRSTPTLDQMTPPVYLPEQDIEAYGTAAFRNLAIDYRARFIRIEQTGTEDIKRFTKAVKASRRHQPRYLTSDQIAHQNLLFEARDDSAAPLECLTSDIDDAWEELGSAYIPPANSLRPESLPGDSYWYLIGSSLVALSRRGRQGDRNFNPQLILFPVSPESEAHLRDNYTL